MADADGDGRIKESEFVLFKLQEMGAVAGEDVEMARKLFRSMDKDGDGDLSMEEVMNSSPNLVS